jgi:hypothetical protein
MLPLLLLLLLVVLPSTFVFAERLDSDGPGFCAHLSPHC